MNEINFKCRLRNGDRFVQPVDVVKFGSQNEGVSIRLFVEVNLDFLLWIHVLEPQWNLFKRPHQRGFEPEVIFHDAQGKYTLFKKNIEPAKWCNVWVCMQISGAHFTNTDYL